MAPYLETHRNQYLMLPVHLDQLVDEDHLAKKIWKRLNKNNCETSRSGLAGV